MNSEIFCSIPSVRAPRVEQVRLRDREAGEMRLASRLLHERRADPPSRRARDPSRDGMIRTRSPTGTEPGVLRGAARSGRGAVAARPRAPWARASRASAPSTGSVRTSSPSRRGQSVAVHPLEAHDARPGEEPLDALLRRLGLGREHDRVAHATSERPTSDGSVTQRASQRASVDRGPRRGGTHADGRALARRGRRCAAGRRSARRASFASSATRTGPSAYSSGSSRVVAEPDPPPGIRSSGPVVAAPPRSPRRRAARAPSLAPVVAPRRPGPISRIGSAVARSRPASTTAARRRPRSRPPTGTPPTVVRAGTSPRSSEPEPAVRGCDRRAARRGRR